MKLNKAISVFAAMALGELALWVFDGVPREILLLAALGVLIISVIVHQVRKRATIGV